MYLTALRHWNEATEFGPRESVLGRFGNFGRGLGWIASTGNGTLGSLRLSPGKDWEESLLQLGSRGQIGTWTDWRTGTFRESGGLIVVVEDSERLLLELLLLLLLLSLELVKLTELRCRSWELTKLTCCCRGCCWELIELSKRLLRLLLLSRPLETEEWRWLGVRIVNNRAAEPIWISWWRHWRRWRTGCCCGRWCSCRWWRRWQGCKLASWWIFKSNKLWCFRRRGRIKGWEVWKSVERRFCRLSCVENKLNNFVNQFNPYPSKSTFLVNFDF